MDYFLIGVGIIGFVLAVSAYVKAEKLEKRLKQKGVLDEDWENSRN